VIGFNSRLTLFQWTSICSVNVQKPKSSYFFLNTGIRIFFLGKASFLRKKMWEQGERKALSALHLFSKVCST
jgi:hypothetical protein